MSMGYANEEILAYYQKIRTGDLRQRTEYGFLARALQEIQGFSAHELLHAVCGQDLDRVIDVLDQANVKFTDEMMSQYGSYESKKFDNSKYDELIQALKTRPGELDKEFLPEIANALGIIVDNPIGVVNAVGIEFFINFVKSKIPAAANYEWDRDTNKFRNIASDEISQINNIEYRSTLNRKLDKIINHEQSLSPDEEKLAIASLYLANFMWQAAFLMKYSAKRTGQVGAENALQQLNEESDFASFDNMVIAVYEKYKDQGIEKAIVLTVLKLIQDLAEYIDDPQLAQDAAKV